MKNLFTLGPKVLFLIFLQILSGSIHIQAQVNYTQQTAYYTSGITSGGGTFDNGGTEMGMWANGGGNKQVVAFRQFRTNGTGGGSAAILGVGGTFTITVSAKRAYGKIGVALLASPSTGTNWADRESNYAITAELDGPAYTGGGWGSWYTKYSGGATSATTVTGDENNFNDFTLTFTKTSSTQMAVVINGQTLSNLTLNTTADITHWSVFLQDDWTGSANANIFWKATTVLPITLTKFTATQRNAQENVLTWSTTSEKDNEYFAIQRSADGNKYDQIGRVQGAGTTVTEQHYTFSDLAPLAGMNYYRLASVATNGEIDYSPVVTVNNKSKQWNSLVVLPNQVADAALVKIDASEDTNLEIMLFDQVGRIVMRSNYELFKGENAINIDLSDLAKGVYVLKAGQETTKLVKVY